MLDTTLEWCQDWYGPYQHKRQTDPVGAEKSIAKVVRGGLPDILVKEYTYPESFYYRPGNRAGIAPAFDGFSVPVDSQVMGRGNQNEAITNEGLAGIVYDDLKMSNPLVLYPISVMNSAKLKWISMNNWAAKWQGFIESPYTGEITFSVECDNNIEIVIDGNPVIAGSGNNDTLSGTISLIAGQKYPLQIIYFHDGGMSFLKLYWSWQDEKREIVPKRALTHSEKIKNALLVKYKKGIFSRYVEPSIGFRIVQAPEIQTKPTSFELPFVNQCVKQNPMNTMTKPKKSYFRKRYLHTVPPDHSTRDEIYLSGMHPSFGGHNHHPSIIVCQNGDLLATYFSSEYEDAPEVSLMASRLRFGSDEWDLPSPIADFPDVNDVSPLLWRENEKIYLFWGNIHLKGGYPFQWIESTDNGASFSEVKFPGIGLVFDGFAPQPITSIFRDNDRTIYLACDGVGAQSLLWASTDDGKNWFDTGGRTGGRHTAIVPLEDGLFFGMGGKKSDIDGFMPISISSDRGKSWKISQSIFPSLGGGQRPALLRLQSGRLLYAGDFQRKDGFQPQGIKERGAFVAISGDEGKSWKIKKIPGTLESSDDEIAREMKGGTLGYVSLAQGANEMIHLITSKNAPALHFEFNEAWIYSDRSGFMNANDLMQSSATGLTHVKTYEEFYPDGEIKARFAGGIADDGRFILDGREEWYYQNGDLKYETEFKVGKKISVEKYYSPSGIILWERKYNVDEFTWIQYWDNGKLKSKSHWKNMICNGPAVLSDYDGGTIRQVMFVNGRIINNIETESK